MAAQSLVLAIAVILFSTCNANVPEISLSQLTSALESKDKEIIGRLLDAGGKLGAFAVTDVGPDLVEAVGQYRQLAPECLSSLEVPQIELEDGSVRRTYATDDGK